MTWKEYKNNRFTKEEQIIFYRNFEDIYYAFKNENTVNQNYKMIVAKLKADSNKYMIEAILDIFFTIDSIVIEKAL